MNGICVATSSSRAYYAAVSMLKKTGLQFRSVVPGENAAECELVLTSAEEISEHGDRALDIGTLSGDPGIFKGQLISRLTHGTQSLVIGVDPGARIGLAVFYGDTNLGFGTFSSVASLCSRVGEFVRKVQSKKSVVRVGNGNLELAVKIAERLREEIGDGAIELVNEAGTSGRTSAMRGIQGDQSAAAKIAFRKGATFEGYSRSQRSS